MNLWPHVGHRSHVNLWYFCLRVSSDAMNVSRCVEQSLLHADCERVTFGSALCDFWEGHEVQTFTRLSFSAFGNVSSFNWLRHPRAWLRVPPSQAFATRISAWESSIFMLCFRSTWAGCTLGDVHPKLPPASAGERSWRRDETKFERSNMAL